MLSNTSWRRRKTTTIMQTGSYYTLSSFDYVITSSIGSSVMLNQISLETLHTAQVAALYLVSMMLRRIQNLYSERSQHQ